MNNEKKKKILEKYEWDCCRYDLSRGERLCTFFGIYYPKYGEALERYLYNENIINHDDPIRTINVKYFSDIEDTEACLTFRYWVLEDFLDKVKP
jgi:hypothetical protein